MALTQVQSEGIGDGEVKSADLENSGVTAGTYGSSSAIPAITVDAKGRITSASTNSVTQVGGANGVDFNDSVKARFGTGNDLEVYHDGSHSHIVNSTGNLRILADGTGDLVLTSKVGEEAILCAQDGAVTIKHDNATKLTTTSTGIDVTGTVVCDGLNCTNSPTFSASTPYINLDDTNSTGGSASTSYIRGRDQNGTVLWYVGEGSSQRDALILYAATGTTELFASGTKRAEINSSGFVPGANSTYDLGTSSARWNNIYTNGILFNGDTAAANKLDDYEEGSWTPVFQYNYNGWNTASFSDSPNNSTGKYVKVGNLVHFSYYTSSFQVTSGVQGNQARISGLPYNAYNDGGAYSGAFFYHTNAFQQTIYTGYVDIGNNVVDPIQGNSTSRATWNGSSNRYLMISGTYRTT